MDLHEKRFRKKIKSNLNSSRMAETNRALNQSMSGAENNLFSPTGAASFNFESSRNSAETLLKT